MAAHGTLGFKKRCIASNHVWVVVVFTLIRNVSDIPVATSVSELFTDCDKSLSISAL